MAMAISCAAVAGATAMFASHTSQQATRCSADPSSSSFPSTTAASNSGVRFPLAGDLLRQRNAEAAENVSASSSSSNGRPAILDPALQHANLMWFKGSYNAQIFVSEDEPADSVVRRFRKAVMQAGVIPECRRRRFFETPQDIAKRKLQAAQRRNKSRRFSPRTETFGADKKLGGASKGDEDDDYWGYTDETS